MEDHRDDPVTPVVPGTDKAGPRLVRGSRLQAVNRHPRYGILATGQHLVQVLFGLCLTLTNHEGGLLLGRDLEQLRVMVY